MKKAKFGKPEGAKLKGLNHLSDMTASCRKCFVYGNFSYKSKDELIMQKGNIVRVYMSVDGQSNITSAIKAKSQ